MQKIIKFFKENDNFIVTSHFSPDGDNIGSCIAMTKFLQNLNKKAYHFLDDKTPENLNYITNNSKIYKSQDFENIDLADGFNLIVLDCGNKARVGIKENLISMAKNIICIDHHESNEYFGDLNYVEKDTSSTCEVIYKILKEIDETKICPFVATCLFTGLSTDTGNFKFDCTSQSSFYMAADLLNKKADMQTAIISLYQSDDYNYKAMESDIFLNFTEKIDDICIMTLPLDILKKYNVDLKDTENLVNNTINLDGIKVGILLKEKEKGVIKGSLRSKKIINVSDISKEFDGGGHARAAGFTIKDTNLGDAKIKVLNVVKKYINNL